MRCSPSATLCADEDCLQPAARRAAALARHMPTIATSGKLYAEFALPVRRVWCCVASRLLLVGTNNVCIARTCDALCSESVAGFCSNCSALQFLHARANAGRPRRLHYRCKCSSCYSLSVACHEFPAASRLLPARCQPIPRAVPHACLLMAANVVQALRSPSPQYFHAALAVTADAPAAPRRRRVRRRQPPQPLAPRLEAALPNAAPVVAAAPRSAAVLPSPPVRAEEPGAGTPAAPQEQPTVPAPRLALQHKQRLSFGAVTTGEADGPGPRGALA